MEDALAHTKTTIKKMKKFVLILVVMEDALAHYGNEILQCSPRS